MPPILEAIAAYNGWFYWALLSAVFAALTAIFAKLGLMGVDSDLATLLRTFVIAIVLGTLVGVMGKWTNPLNLAPKTLGFLVLSGLATGASWVCYFRALSVGEASKQSPRLTNSAWSSWPFLRLYSWAKGLAPVNGWAFPWSVSAWSS
jgi:transporter family protein